MAGDRQDLSATSFYGITLKLIKVHQLINEKLDPHLVSELYLNKDIIRWAIQKKVNGRTFTQLLLIADDKPLNILETPSEINNLCNFIQEVEIVGRSKK